MRLERVTLANVRNYEALELTPEPGINAFVGPNAQGKSNLLEAVAMLGTGKSFRTSRDADVVREGSESAAVRGDARVRAGQIVLACAVTKTARATRKAYTLNGRAVRYSSFLGRLRVVTFVPSDLQLAAGAPSLRRGFLNAALSQEDPAYFRDLAAYRTALQQKNALLRDAEPDLGLLAVYDGVLLETGTRIVGARARFVATLAAAARDAHGRFATGETLDVAYEPNLRLDDFGEAAIAAAFAERLEQYAQRERVAKRAVVGPHRDDLMLNVDGKPLAAFGSQGQQRTAVLSLKVAEYAVALAATGEAPLLLLDDVLSELDDARSAAFLAGIGAYEQAFVTATHLPPVLAGRASLYAVADGRIRLEQRTR